MRIGILALCLLVAGCDDYEVAVSEHKHYCDMVEKGHWPHYNKHKVDCSKEALSKL